jgi:hypothetical protein
MLFLTPRGLFAAHPQAPPEDLPSRIAEATQLCRLGMVQAGRTLLEGLIADPRRGAAVARKAIYWVARAKVEEVRKVYRRTWHLSVQLVYGRKVNRRELVGYPSSISLWLTYP